MHQVYNAGIGEDESHGWCDSMVVCRGRTGKIISQAEKNLYDNDIGVLLLAKEGIVMRDLATRFVEKKNAKHGEDVWVLLFCDNLSAHLDEEVKRTFGNAKVLLFYFPPNMTNFIQPIDAGLGRTVRISIGHFLDQWLMD